MKYLQIFLRKSIDNLEKPENFYYLNKFKILKLEQFSTNHDKIWNQ